MNYFFLEVARDLEERDETLEKIVFSKNFDKEISNTETSQPVFENIDSDYQQFHKQNDEKQVFYSDFPDPITSPEASAPKSETNPELRSQAEKTVIDSITSRNQTVMLLPTGGFVGNPVTQTVNVISQGNANNDENKEKGKNQLGLVAFGVIAFSAIAGSTYFFSQQLIHRDKVSAMLELRESFREESTWPYVEKFVEKLPPKQEKALQLFDKTYPQLRANSRRETFGTFTIAGSAIAGGLLNFCVEPDGSFPLKHFNAGLVLAACSGASLLIFNQFYWKRKTYDNQKKLHQQCRIVLNE